MRWSHGGGGHLRRDDLVNPTGRFAVGIEFKWAACDFGRHVNLSRLITPERVNACREWIAPGDHQTAEAPVARTWRRLLHAEQSAIGRGERLAVVTKNILALQGWNRGAAIDETTDDGSTNLRQCGCANRDADMGILGNRRDQRQTSIRCRGIVGKRALHDAPAVVPARSDEVEFLHFVLPHIGLEYFSTSARPIIKRKAPGIAQTIGINLLAHATSSSHEGVGRRNTILAAGAVGS